MEFLKKIHEQQHHLFEKGGKFEKLYPLWEAHDTAFFTPGHVTKGRTHVRDALDLKRMMITVVVALLPIVLFAVYNTGMQANSAIEAGNATPLETWQTAVFQALGFTFVNGTIENIVHGLLYFLPVFITTFAVGGLIEVGTAIVRKHEVNEGFLVSGFLIPLIVPATIPLWQLALGTAFGILVGKEVFGGTGMNILNPALTARAFLFFAYPGQISGDKVWLAADLNDGASGATWLAKFAVDPGALEGQELFGDAWMDAFLGFITGSMGETSAALCLLGAIILIVTQIGSWRTMVGVVVGTFIMATLLNVIGSDSNPMFAVPFYWHIVIGGWAFGTVFMATDPVSSAFTDRGKLIYGFGIGVLVILVRVVNPAYPEGMMLAILFMNMFAPLIDHFVVEANVRRRLARVAD